MKIKALWNTVSSFFRSEWEKIRPLPWKDKLSYIWEYYKVHLLIITFVLYAFISVGISIYNAHKGGEVVFGVGVINDLSVPDEFPSQLASGFGEYLGLTYGDQQVKVETSYTVSDNTTNEYQDVLNTIIFVDASAGDIDAVICLKEVLEFFPASQEPWLDLSTVLDAETLESLSDRLYYYTDAEGNPFPCGIRLTDKTLGTESELTLTEPYLAFAGGASHLDYIDDFVNYLLAGEVAE